MSLSEVNRQMPKCLRCSYTLQKKYYKNHLWYACTHCSSNYVSTNSLKEILSDYEFNRIKSEITQEKVISSKNCPCCKLQMIIILDLVRANQVEVCKSCQLVWLDPQEGAKIKSDQDHHNKSDRKMNLNLQYVIDIKYSELRDQPLYPAFTYNQHLRNIRLGVLAEIYKFIIKVTLLEEISKNYPMLAFFLANIITLLFIVFIFYFSGMLHDYFYSMTM